MQIYTLGLGYYIILVCVYGLSANGLTFPLLGMAELYLILVKKDSENTSSHFYIYFCSEMKNLRNQITAGHLVPADFQLFII